MDVLWNVLVFVVVLEMLSELLEEKYKRYYTMIINIAIISLLFSYIFHTVLVYDGKNCRIQMPDLTTDLQEKEQNEIEKESIRFMEEINNYYDEMEKKDNGEGKTDESADE